MIMKESHYLDLGFVKLLNVGGTETDIENAARQSYDESSTTRKSDMRGLLRYLIQNHHTSPLEIANVTFQIKVPIFIARQILRHRTGKYNEMSMRYSKAAEYDYYIPDKLYYQSDANKQCSSDDMVEGSDDLLGAVKDVCHDVFDLYNLLIDRGVSREQARIILPVSTYTTITMQMDLHNLMHFLKLRLHSHAQSEIRILAQIMLDMFREYVPNVFEAFDDFILNSVDLNQNEYNELADQLYQLDLVELKDWANSGKNLQNSEFKRFVDKLIKLKENRNPKIIEDIPF